MPTRPKQWNHNALGNEQISEDRVIVASTVCSREMFLRLS